MAHYETAAFGSTRDFSGRKNLPANTTTPKNGKNSTQLKDDEITVEFVERLISRYHQLAKDLGL